MAFGEGASASIVRQDRDIDIRVFSQGLHNAQSNADGIDHNHTRAQFLRPASVFDHSIGLIGDVGAVDGAMARFLVDLICCMPISGHTLAQWVEGRITQQLIILDNIRSATRRGGKQGCSFLRAVPGTRLDHVQQNRTLRNVEVLAQARDPESRPSESSGKAG